MFIKSQPTILLQIFRKITHHSQDIIKSLKDPDTNFRSYVLALIDEVKS